ncbi:deoxyribonuclease-2-beta-like [Nelusetta ayraudi]|uniref:deoxyribonuclease-2-beta-like n=1 Tax=Nelusetta ayraudi TaxID=303726 RepID=UPI003F72E9B0
MWTFVLTISLLCWASEAAVTCKNNNDAVVDWFIIYKTPVVKSRLLTGLQYIYMDSTGATESTPNNKLINDPRGILANTLRPLLTPVRQMLPTFGYISYSDQPPGWSADQEFGHSKGVLLVDSRNYGVWLMHSTPQFPYRRNINNFWPPSGAANAQTFICVTLPYNQFVYVGLHLQYINAFSFDHDVPANFHRQLIEAVDWKKLDPVSSFQQLTTAGNNQFHAVAKQQLQQQKDGDLYVTIGRLIGSDVFAQTWGGQRDRSRSYCVTNLPKVYNVKSIHTSVGDWKPSCDHSKWCVAKNQNNNWVCIVDVNRAPTQYRRRGGALCLQNAIIKRNFYNFVGGNEDCNVPVTTDPCNTRSTIA